VNLTKTLLAEISVFFEPLFSVLESTENNDLDPLESLLFDLGYIFDGSKIPQAIAELNGIKAALGALLDATQSTLNDGFQIEDIDSVKNLAKASFKDIDNIKDPFSEIIEAGFSGENSLTLAEDLTNYLVTLYLNKKSEFAINILTAIGAYRKTTIPKSGSPRSRGARYNRHTYYWSRIKQLITDTDDWAREVYGWGDDFNVDAALFYISACFTFSGLQSYERDMTLAQLDAFFPDRPDNAVGGTSIVAPLFTHNPSSNTSNFDPNLNAEVGFAAFPIQGQNAALEDLGLAFSPYGIGAFTGRKELSPNVDVNIEGSLSGVGGTVFAIRPSGVNLLTGIENTALQGAFGISFDFHNQDDNEKIIVFGSADGTRLQFDDVTLKFGGAVSSQSNYDVYLAAGLKNLTVVIDPGDDGLLSSVVTSPIEINAGDIALGWRPGRGIYFEGGSNLSFVIPVDLNLGPLNIHGFGLDLEFTSPVTIKITTTADLTIGPLFAYAEGMGISAKITEAPNGDGLLGKHDLNFGFVSPTGYAISLDGGAIKGGGMLSVMEDEYRGALALKFSKFGFSAFGILNTTLPDGEDGFSFAASIFADINVPLSFGFFLTGLGGFIGINRTINTQALRDVLYEGRLDNLIFSADPIENAKTILEDMAEIMPAYKGNHLFGPVARIGWGQPVLIDIKLGVIIELGDNVRILILGGLGVALPTKDSAVVELNVTFFGEIDFGAKTISFDATLLNSRILTFAISGDMALRSGWGPRQEHIVSIGGLHPLFPKPSNLPDLRRITIAFGSDNPRITVEAYSALTSNSLQFGARADLYAKGPNLRILGRFEAIGYVYFDALIYFKPFAFDISLGGGLELLRNGNVILNLGFDLRFRGPNTFHIQGKAWATVLKKKIKISINHRFGSAQSVSIETVDPARVLFKALEKSKGFEPYALPGRTSGVVFTKAGETEQVTDPLGGIRLSQTAIPLGKNIHKVGESALQAGANIVDIVVTNGQSVVPTNPTYSDFVYGHFFRITDAEKLLATAFDSLKSGFEIGGPALIPGNAAPVVEEYSHEYIEIPVPISSDSFVGEVHTNVGNTPAALAAKLDGLDPGNILTQFSQEGLADQLTPEHVYERDWVVSNSVTINNDLFVENTAALSADLSSAVQGSVGEPQVIRDQLSQSAGSHFSAASTQESVTTQATTERNAYVHDYVALAGQLLDQI